MIKIYRKKPIVIEAIKFTTDNYSECKKFLNGNYDNSLNYPNIRTLSGVVECQPEYYICKTIKGDFYPCEPKIFELMHDELSDEEIIHKKCNCRVEDCNCDDAEVSCLPNKVDEKLLSGMDNIINIQKYDGNWNFDPYMQGMLNGMLLIESAVTNKEYKPYSAPKRWKRERWYEKIINRITGKDKPICAESVDDK